MRLNGKRALSVFCRFYGSSGPHHYRNLHPFLTHEELAQFIIREGLIYNEKGIVVINKPYGVKKCKEYAWDHKVKNINYEWKQPILNIESVNVEELIPHLEQALNVPELLAVKVPERYASGVAIFATKRDKWERLKKIYRNHANPPVETYLAVCVGRPIKKEGTCRLGVTLKGKGVHTVTFLEDWERKVMRKGLIRPIDVTHQLVSYNDELEASLISYRMTRTPWLALRAFLALRLLCPLLGDNMFGARVKKLSGIPVLLDASNPLAKTSQKLSEKFSKALGLRPTQGAMVPMHLHLARTEIISNKIGGDKLIFEAEPPAHFLKTCEKLNLELPDRLDSGESSLGEKNANCGVVDRVQM